MPHVLPLRWVDDAFISGNFHRELQTDKPDILVDERHFLDIKGIGSSLLE